MKKPVETICEYPAFIERRMREHNRLYGKNSTRTAPCPVCRLEYQRGYSAGVRAAEKSWQAGLER